MKKHIVLLTTLLLLLNFTGCKEDPIRQKHEPWKDDLHSISIYATHTVIRGFNGDLREETISAVARDINNVGIVGVPIVFSIVDPEPFKGAITQEDSLTDEFCSITATYSVELSRDNFHPHNEIVIAAKCGDVENEITLDVAILDDRPPILIEAPDIIYAPAGEFRKCEIFVAHLDTSGIAREGIPLLFTVSPDTMGFMEQDTMLTGQYGRCTNLFNTIPDHYGSAVITVTDGYYEGSTRIDIRPE